jgi:ethanolamine utilization protein EutN
MRIAKVIGTVTLNRRIPDLVPARYLVVQPRSRQALAGGAATPETLVLYDDLGAREGDLVGLVEGREAACPFHPNRVPYDCYNACILDDVEFEPVL